MSLHSNYVSHLGSSSDGSAAPQTSFTLFLGELYLQFGETTAPGADAEKKRVPELAEALRSLLSAHVNKGKENLKIVEQTLKVCRKKKNEITLVL